MQLQPRYKEYSFFHLQTSIKFTSEFKTVMLIKKWRDPVATKALCEVIGHLREVRDQLLHTHKQVYGTCIMVEPYVIEELQSSEDESALIASKEVQAFDKDHPGKGIDFVVVLGGDGTLLHLNSLFQGLRSFSLLNFRPKFHSSSCRYCVRVFGIFGSLWIFGLQKPFKNNDVWKSTRSLIALEVRWLLSPFNGLRLLGEMHTTPGGKPVATYQALNEILIDRGTSPYLTRLEFYVDDQLATHIQADGVIISSATGSTAYSLSAGGTLYQLSISNA